MKEAKTEDRIYAAIDLKSFYASVECADRGLDPLRTNLVVADETRTDKTICLAVSPSLKAFGLPGRPRLFEVKERVRACNAERSLLGRRKRGGAKPPSSCDADVLSAHPEVLIDYLTARPRMARYVEVSTRIYGIYLRYIAPEDMVVYSIDEVFLDLTPYLGLHRMTAHELVRTMIRDVLSETGITATAGIGTNLYLAKVAMDIVAKHREADRDGVRIAELDVLSYRRELWAHRPLTDFWRVGRGYAAKLRSLGMETMGDIARCSLGKDGALLNAALLYRLFGVNAELLIDHAWGYEPCTIADIRAYRPQTHSLGSGQVLKEPYPPEKARLIVKEMADLLSLSLTEHGLVTDQITLSLGYDRENLKRGGIDYRGETALDHYGRAVPKPAHKSARLPFCTASTRLLCGAFLSLYDEIAGEGLLLRRLTLTAEHVRTEEAAQREEADGQLCLMLDPPETLRKREAEERLLEKEKRLQLAVAGVRRRFGKNAVLKGMNLQEGGTTIERNAQIGGHRS